MENHTIFTGSHELENCKIGDTLTINEYRPAKVGTGMDKIRQVTGELVEVAATITRRYGCSFTWRKVIIKY